MNELNVCINYTINTFPNLQIIKTMFDDITCSGYNSSNMISKLLYISDTFKFCLNGTEVHNVKTSAPGKNEQFCGKQYFLFPSLYLFISHSSCIFTSCINISYFSDKIILMILFRLDFRDISTSDTTPKMTKEATISSALETTFLSTDAWFKEKKDSSNTSESKDFFSKDDSKVVSSKYANI